MWLPYEIQVTLHPSTYVDEDLKQEKTNFFLIHYDNEDNHKFLSHPLRYKSIFRTKEHDLSVEETGSGNLSLNQSSCR